MDVVLTGPPAVVPQCQWDFPDLLTPPKRRRGIDADDSGLLAMGADLQPSTLVHAYRNGIFPWPQDDNSPLPWCSPNPRGLLGLDKLRISHSLSKTMRRSGWVTTVNRAFSDVMLGCSIRPNGGTWITPEMTAAYTELHLLGWAHSIEVWEDSELVGGLYGMLLGGVFTGESMFHRRTDASKVAFSELALRLLEAGGAFVDVQLPTPHLDSLGVIAVHRALFIELLRECRDDDIRLTTDPRPASRIPAEYTARAAAMS